MDVKTAVREIKKKYQGLGWPTLFTKIRFFTAPYLQLAPYIPKEGFIVDLGCGYGIFSNLLALISEKREVLGLEFDELKMKYANRGFSNARFETTDITKANIPPADCVLLIHVLHHLNSYDEQEKLIEACFQNLKNGGKLIICEVDKYPFWKFILSQIADHLLYPGDHIYYRFPDSLLALLNKFFTDISQERMHQGTPFSHITYICAK